MKQFITYLIGFSIVSVLGYTLHNLLLPQIVAASPIDLMHLYLFFGIFSLLLCATLLALSKTKKFKDQIGFLYLASVVLKIAAFAVVFSEHIFSERSFSNSESVNLLIPMFLNIGLEVFFLTRILKKSTPSKNAI